MKTLKSIVLVAVLLVSGMSVVKADKNGKESKSSASLDVTIASLPNDKVIIGFDKLEMELVRIKIFNAEGELIHEEKFTEKTTYLKRFDMSNLPVGRYSYVVNNENYSVKKVIEKK